ncbi:unnamed protein product, partial [Closterium sp. NIES-53]
RSRIRSCRIPVLAALWPWQQEQEKQQQGDKAQRIRSALVGGAGSAAAEETERSGLRAGEPPVTATALTVTVSSSIASIPAADWDACALDAAGGAEKHNPFVSHAFLQCLEESRSACREEGWLPQHLVARDDEERVVGVLPLYLKGHSYGEYVFDHSWANALMRAGGSYYPKLQSCVPFTPATGPRLLVRDGPDREAVLSGLCQAMKQVADEYGVSSVHVTFPCKDDWQVMARHGFLQRMGMQYHWSNRGYGSFNDFLMDLKQSKRKTIRQERKKVAAQGLKLLRLRGDDIKAHHWNSFFQFYCNTTNRKWGQTYLTREFFHLLGERLGEKVLLVVAEDEIGRMVGGALNLVGGEAVFGRNWGALPGTHYPFLHFEACYYQGEHKLLSPYPLSLPHSHSPPPSSLPSIPQAIEAAIEAGLARVEAGHNSPLGQVLPHPRPLNSNPLVPHPPSSSAQAIEAAIEAGLARVEAGAQGEHKLPRGYLPTATYSAHHIPDPAFRSAIAGFLERETVQVCLDSSQELLDAASILYYHCEAICPPPLTARTASLTLHFSLLSRGSSNGRLYSSSVAIGRLSAHRHIQVVLLPYPQLGIPFFLGGDFKQENSQAGLEKVFFAHFLSVFQVSTLLT